MSSGLASLVLATVSFVGTHLLMSHPLRPALVRGLGERAFLGVYSLVSFVTLGWMIWAARTMEPNLLAVPAFSIWPIAAAVMLMASVLLVGSLLGNPALPDPTGAPRMPDRARGVFAITRHPMMWSFILWALVHVLVWPSDRSLVIGFGIGFLAFVGAHGQDVKKLRLIGEPWRAWCAKTSFWPFAALVTGRAAWRDAFPGWIALIGGVALWLLATWLHPLLGGPWLPPWAG
jgi:uncharacterized membrane protein